MLKAENSKKTAVFSLRAKEVKQSTADILTETMRAELLKYSNHYELIEKHITDSL